VNRIVLVAAALTGGGAERQLSCMANYCAARGERVSLVTWSGTEVEDFYALDERVERFRLGIALARSRWELPWVLGRRVRMLRRFVRERRPDAVVSFITGINVLTLLACAGTGLQVIVSDRAHQAMDVTISAPWRFLRRVLYRFASRVVAQTSQARAWSRDHCGVDAVVIPNVLRPLPASSLEREALVVSVGRLDPQKGFDLLLRAFATLAARFPDWKVAILGIGPQRDELLALRDSLGLGQRVSFVGEVRDVENWLARASLVVQASRYEGFPNAVLEAMGTGAAVISSDCLAGPSDLIQDGVNGRLVGVDDVDGLARAMEALMASPDLRARLGTAAAGVRDTYRLESIMARWNAALGFTR